MDQQLSYARFIMENPKQGDPRILYSIECVLSDETAHLLVEHWG